MAVYKRTYKGYTGALTTEWQRFWVIPRNAWGELSRFRLLNIFFVLCFFYPLGCALAIYLNHNLGFLAQYVKVRQPMLIGNQFFYIFTSVQCTLAFLLTSFIGPGLISSDLANNGLPLYFCRPLSRTGYVAGKMSVLLVLLSTITWVPGLLLFTMQAYMAEAKWMEDYGYLAGAIFFSSVIWIVVISVISLALSAWVRWRIVAGALMLVVLFLGAGIAQAINQVMRTKEGSWFDIATNFGRVSLHLFQIDISDSESFPIENAVAALVLASAFCIWLLAKKVKAFEVVK